MASRLGMVLIVCAPSGAGKSTLIGRLRAEFPDIGFSVSCTTRTPRAGEVDGRDYEFLSREQFISRRDDGYFAEWAEVHGNFYGTPRAPVLEKLSRGIDVIFDVDVQGAAALRGVFPDAVFLFILPPSMEILAARLRGRGTDSPEVAAKRLKNALGEIEKANEFCYLIVNDDLEAAYRDFRAVYRAEGLKTARRPDLARQILGGTAPAR